MSVTKLPSNCAAGQSGPASGLQVQISVSVLFCDTRSGTTVPLGASSDCGEWLPLDLDISAALDQSVRNALINWLTHGDIVGESIVADSGAAVAAVAETRQRCLLLAEQRKSQLQTVEPSVSTD